MLTLEAPCGRSVATLSLYSGSNSHTESVTASDDGRVHVSISAHHPKRCTPLLRRGAQRERRRQFAPRPSPTAVLESLSQVPRLRVVVAGQTIEAWQGATHSLVLHPRQAPEVTVDLGNADARARVTVLENGKQRSRRGLNARGTARAVEEALGTASRIEIDADNLGRITLTPSRVAPNDARWQVAANDRLAWRDFVLSNAAQGARSSALIHQPKATTSLAPRSVTAAGLSRARLGLRRSRATGSAS